jgi:hypothetical protein
MCPDKQQHQKELDAFVMHELFLLARLVMEGMPGRNRGGETDGKACGIQD